MEHLFETGHIIDLILVLVAAEYLALRFYFGSKISELGLEGYLLSGALLLVALRAALAESSWMWVAAPLTGAFVVHLIDLHRRLTKRFGNPS